MDLIGSGEVKHAGTYNGNPLSTVAGLTALRDVLTEESYNSVFRLNETLTNGYAEIITKYNLPAYATSIGACGTIHFSEKPIENHRDWEENVDKDLAQKYWHSMKEKGIIPCPYPLELEEWTVSVQHTENDINTHLEAFEQFASNIM